MALEIAPGQLCDCLVAVGRRLARHAVVEQGIRVVSSRTPAAADHRFQLQMHEHVGEPLALAVQPVLIEAPRDFASLELPAAGERSAHDLFAAVEGRDVQSEVSVAGRIRLLHARRGESE